MLNQSGKNPELFPAKFSQIASFNTKLSVSIELEIACITAVLTNVNELFRDDCWRCPIFTFILKYHVVKFSLKHYTSTETFYGFKGVFCDILHR